MSRASSRGRRPLAPARARAPGGGGRRSTPPLSLPKITPPIAPPVAPRRRLHRRLDALFRRSPVVWVSAPAGSGKTTLAASWLHAAPRRSVWIRVDARDGDPAAFFHSLREAARRASPRRRPRLPLLTPEHGQGLDAYARRIFEALGEALGAGGVLVLDDWQELPEDAALERLLPEAVAALPEEVRILVLSRGAPPPSFARALTQGRVAVLEGPELDLTAAETRALARRRGRPAPTSRAVAALRAATRGWVAGTLVLLQHQREDGPLPATGGAGGRPQLLFDYFAAEAFERADPATRRFLLATSVLPQIGAAAARALTGDEAAEDVLAGLARRNHFTHRLAGAEPRYEYHPLFREFLRARARRELGGARWEALARRGAELLLAGGAVDDAAALLIESRDHDGLARLALAHAPAFLAQGRHTTVDAWVGALPPAAIEAAPWLRYFLGVCRTRVRWGTRPAAFSLGEARAHFEGAYRAFRARGDAVGSALAWASYVGTFLHAWDRAAALEPWLDEADEVLGTLPPLPSADAEATVTFAMLGALLLARPRDPALPRWADRALELARRSDVPAAARLRIASLLVQYLLWWRSDLRAAAALLEALRPLESAPDATPFTELLWCQALSAYHAQAGDARACLAAVERGLARVAETGARRVGHTLALHGACGALSGQDLATARRLHAVAARHHGGEQVFACLQHVMGGWIAMCEGDGRRAEPLLALADESARASGAEGALAGVRIARAQLLVDQGRSAEALDVAGACLAWARAAGNALYERASLLTAAHARAAAGDEAAALAPLREGLALGRERHLPAHPLLGWRRDTMARLAALALRHDVEPAHVRELVAELRLVPPDGARGLEAWPWPLRIRVLGRFEVERDGAPLAFAQRRPLELLRTLAVLGGRDVPQAQLCEALWPDADGAQAHRAFDTTLYRLRRGIGDEEALRLEGGRLGLDPARCWVDLWAFERSSGEALALLRGGAEAAGLARAEAALALYRGPPSAPDGVRAAETARERLRRRHRGLVEAVVERLERRGERARARAVQEAALDVEPLVFGRGRA